MIACKCFRKRLLELGRRARNVLFIFTVSNEHEGKRRNGVEVASCVDEAEVIVDHLHEEKNASEQHSSAPVKVFGCTK
jgi:hypothetical protein